MKTIDLSLFEKDEIVIKISEEKEYRITNVPSVLELKLMNYQNDISSKLSKWDSLDQGDLERWKGLIINIISQQPDQEINKEDINRLYPQQILAILTGLLQHLNKRSRIIFNALDEDVRKEVEKVEDDVKKKAMEKVLSDSVA